MKSIRQETQRSTVQRLIAVTIITISLLLIHSPQPIASQDYGHYGGLIRINDIIGGTITDEVHYIEYTFSGQRGQEIFIFLQAVGSGDLDPVVKLRGPDGPTLEDDDDWNTHAWSTRNSFLRHRLPANGAYTVTATRYREHDGPTSGNFLLWVTDSYPRVAYYGNLSHNQYIVGAISDEIYEVEHTYSGRAGETITITMEKITGDLDPYVKLRGPDSTPLRENDDVGYSNWNSLLTYTLPRTGAYTITATGSPYWDDPTSGEYKLRVVSDAHSQREGGILRPNQVILVDTTIYPRGVTFSFDYYNRFDYTSSTTRLDWGINATVMPTIMTGQRPVLTLYDLHGDQLASISPNSSFAILNCSQLPQTGTYFLTVGGQLYGTYTITFRHPAYAR